MRYININKQRHLKIRPINTELQKRSEPDCLQNSLSHYKCEKVVDHTKYEDDFKSVYIKLKYILEKEEKEVLQLQINASFVFVLIDKLMLVLSLLCLFILVLNILL